MVWSESIERALARIREREGEVRAWVEVSPQPALAEGPLSGTGFAAKDTFETGGLATEYGSPIYAGRRGTSDAALVEMLRRRGAVLLGKTQTTAFAYFDPAPTRNPRRLTHTPGGSSSGSAAAVADGMAEFAIGSQTQGSVIRPASYCGIVGFKPSHGLLPVEGLLPFAPTLDTAGLFTTTVSRMRELWAQMGFPVGDSPPQPLAALPVPDHVEAPMRQAFFSAVAQLGAIQVDPPVSLDEVFETIRLINDYEGSRTFRTTYDEHGRRIGVKLAELIERGLRVAEKDYRMALDNLQQARRAMEQCLAAYPILLSPAAQGPPPEGLTSTGNPIMNGAWTGLGVPVVSVPMPVGQALPLGLQLAADRNQEERLLAAAFMVENELAA
ncbi:MAG: amidase [Acidimicrobiia bacterium]|nr:amidase [Acidimicrobiia bacterium]